MKIRSVISSNPKFCDIYYFICHLLNKCKTDYEMQIKSLIQLFPDQQSRRPINFPANFGGCVYCVGCSEAGKVNVKSCH